MSFPVNGVEEFILIDNEQEFAAMRGKEGVEIKNYTDMPSVNDSTGVKLVKLSDGHYNGYECDIYEAVVGQGTLTLYFDKGESTTFNSFITKFLGSRGIAIDANTIPNGKIVLIQDEEFEEGGFSIELKGYSENQHIAFTLKTSE